MIDTLQKDILSIVHKEEPFDVFICYKETDELGQRTQDSVLAQDIYTELTDKGFRVFFSRITLEDKLGHQYEPYIFAALNSAKVMLAIGTKEEYYNAVWVKNEWSRFLSLMEKDKEKMLIPCYRDIDPYDMPQEFKNLQGQDMSRLGFLQDLVRGITKIIEADVDDVVKEIGVVQNGVLGNGSELVKRGLLALEDGEWTKADEFFEQALNYNAEDSQAYLGKLMAELQVKKQEDLKNYPDNFEDNLHCEKVLRFGDEPLRNEIAGYISYIKQRNEQARMDAIYESAMIAINENTIPSLEEAIRLFGSVIDWKDSVQKKTEAEEKLSILKQQAQEQERKRAEYDNKYPLVKDRKDIINYIDTVKSEIKTLENINTLGEHFLVAIFAITFVAFVIGTVFALLSDEAGLSIIYLILSVITGLLSYVGICGEINRGRRLKELWHELEVLNQKLEKIKNAPSFEEFCREEK